MKFDRNKVRYTLHVEQEEIEVRGNAVCTVDPVYDKRYEDEIIDRLDGGDVWAWARVKVTAYYDGINDVTGTDSMGGCSYNGEEDFRKCSYYDEMKEIACNDLEVKLDSIFSVLS